MKEVEQYLPHRDPFLFIDDFSVIDPTHYSGTFSFATDHPIFKGHFPGFPVVPGVLLIECMAQCGGAGVMKAGGIKTNQTILLASVSSAKFRRMVHPGDAISFKVETIKVTHRMLCQRGKALVDGKVAAEAEWVCMVGKTPDQAARTTDQPAK